MPWPIVVLLFFAFCLIGVGVLFAIVDACQTITRSRRMVRR